MVFQCRDSRPRVALTLIETVELTGLFHRPAEYLRVVLARHHGFGTRDQGGEEPVEFFKVHRIAAFALAQEIAQAIQFGIGRRLGLRKGLHSQSCGSALSAAGNKHCSRRSNGRYCVATWCAAHVAGHGATGLASRLNPAIAERAMSSGVKRTWFPAWIMTWRPHLRFRVVVTIARFAQTGGQWYDKRLCA
jgi:hypothetical protein